MWTAIGSLLGVVGSGIKGFFGFKGEQAKVVNTAMDVVANINSSDDARAVATAQIISAEARSESFLTRSWRPIVVLSFAGLLIAHLLGYTATNLEPKVLDRLFDIVEASVLGYMGVRSIDKWVKEFQIGSILKKFIDKKLG